MHYYQFNINDYRGGTAHLSVEEDCCYRRLLDLYYDLEDKFPSDSELIARKVRINHSIVMAILEEFFTFDGSRWRNHKADKVIAAYHRKVEGGKKGADSRWNDGIAIAKPEENDGYGYSNHKPITNNHKPITNNQDLKAKSKSKDSCAIALDIDNEIEPSETKSAYSPQFEEFWEIYRKYKPVAKQAAAKKFATILKSGVKAETIIQGLKAQEPDFQRRGNAYVPHPSTWLNQGRWEDEVTTAKRGLPLCEADIEL